MENCTPVLRTERNVYEEISLRFCNFLSSVLHTISGSFGYARKDITLCENCWRQTAIERERHRFVREEIHDHAMYVSNVCFA